MIITPAILLIENAFLTWLFNYAPMTAFTVVLAWLALRLGSSYGNYQARFTKIESDIIGLKSDIVEIRKDQKEMKTELHVMKNDFGSRLGRLEAQMEIIIDLLKGKKSSS